MRWRPAGLPRARGSAIALAAAAALVVAAAALIVPRFAGGRPDLARLEREIAGTYTGVRHATADEVAARLARNAGDVVLFDVREPEEFAVSHIAGAARVSPDVGAADFLAAHGGRLEGKSVVLYCSVGVRSSRLAGKLAEALQQRGASAVYNLSGGIFRWHNERRPLVHAAGRTDHVHPYDRYWGRYLERAALIRTAPVAP